MRTEVSLSLKTSEPYKMAEALCESCTGFFQFHAVRRVVFPFQRPEINIDLYSEKAKSVIEDGSLANFLEEHLTSGAEKGALAQSLKVGFENASATVAAKEAKKSSFVKQTQKVCAKMKKWWGGSDSITPATTAETPIEGVSGFFVRVNAYSI